MIVITLSKVPPSLRGDLTKWYQEVQTGVYVGNVNAKVREQVWERIIRDIGSGQAVMVYNAQNELGYQFRTTRTDHEIVDFDGIPLLKRLNQVKSPSSKKLGFSDAAKFHRIKMYSKRSKKSKAYQVKMPLFVAVDVETTGLDLTKDDLISIGAIKKGEDGELKKLSLLIQTDRVISPEITKLTGLSTEILEKKGVSLQVALTRFLEFIDDALLVGYNLQFDDAFLSKSLKLVQEKTLHNQMIDLLPIVKKRNRFIDNYRLSTVLAEYDITNSTPHHADSDAEATFALAEKLIENQDLIF